MRGSVRQAEGRVRVNVELSDTAKRTQLWSERYDGEGKEVFEIQDRIVKNIVGTLAVKLSKAELDARAKAWKPRQAEFTSGYLWKYAQQVGAARNGALTHPGAAAERACYADI